MAEKVKEKAQLFSTGKKNITVYNPTSVEIMEEIQHFAPRIDSFNGKRIGLLWNGKANGDFYLNRVGELLEKRFSNVSIIKFWEVDPTETAHPEKKSAEALDRVAKSSDIVIASQGD